MEGLSGKARGRVLLVEDERVQLLILERMLSKAGYETDGATCVNQARELLTAHEHDVLILDLSLRDEDSLGLLRSAIEAGRRPKIVFISGMDTRIRAAGSRLARGLGLSLAGTLAKPVAFPKLVALIQSPTTLSEGDHAAGDAPPTAAELAVAIGTGELDVHYQPKVTLATGTLFGFEALARWESPVHGTVPPDVFIPLAEESGLIVPLTAFVLRQAVSTCAHLRNAGLACGMAVNLSAACLHEQDLITEIEVLLRTWHLPPGMLTLELTESCAASDPVALEVLTRLRIHGMGLSIDDFGTGHSSLVSLLRLPFSELKIDKTFVLAMRDDPEAAKIVRAAVALARELGLRSVAEGVETMPLADALRGLGCDIGQGWLFGRPISGSGTMSRFIHTALPGPA